MIDYNTILKKSTNKEAVNSYLSLIYNAKNQNRKRLPKNNSNYVYYEEHHILPRSLFPEYEKEKENKVLLLAREHFEAHKLLTKIFPGQEMAHAFWRMCCCNRNKCIITADEYEEARLYVNSFPGPATGLVTSDETKQKISAKVRNYWKNGGYKHTAEQHKKAAKTRKESGKYNRTIEQNKKASLKLKGRIVINNKIINKFIFPEDLSTYLEAGWLLGKKPLNEEHKKNIGLKNKGHKAWNKGLSGTFLGKHHSTETKQKMSEIKKGKINIDALKPVICIETSIIYSSIKEATQLTGINHIGDCCRGIRKKAGGYHWQYYKK